MHTSAHRWLRWIATGAFLAAATVAFGDDRPQPDKAVRAQGIKFSQVMKYKIFIQDDQPAGQVVDFVFTDGGCIDYVVASYEDQYYVIPYSAATVRYDDSIVFVDLAPTRFEQIQFFAADSWPDFYVPAYRDKVFTTFGVTANRRGQTTFRRDLDDDAENAAERKERREDARDRREENRDKRQDQRENRKDKDTDADDPNRKLDRPLTPDKDRPKADPDSKTKKSNPGSKGKTPPKPDLSLKAGESEPEPKPDPPTPPRANPKNPPVPKAPVPKAPVPKNPVNPKQPTPK